MFIDLRLFTLRVLGSVFLGCVAQLATAGPFQEARLTHLVGKVQFAGDKSIVPAQNVILPDGSLRVGVKSRAEVTFHDGTVMRIGDKSAVGFNSRDRSFQLTAGAILTQVPAGVGGTRIQAGQITAIVTGTTMLVEHYPSGYLKFILLDGSSRLCLKRPGHLNECSVLRAGQMLIASPTPKGLPDAANLDLNRLLETCHLITDFPPLPGQSLLVNAAAKQQTRKAHGAFADTNLVIHGRGTVVSVTKPDGTGTTGNSASSTTPAPSPNATPKPSP